MRFSMLLAGMLITACGPGWQSTSTSKTKVLQVPVFFSQASAVGVASGGFATTLDSKAGLLHQFAVDPFSLQASVEIPFASERQWLLSGGAAGFNVLISGTDYAIVKNTGEVTKNPAPLQGEIQNAALAPDARKLVLMDEYLTMAIVGLSAGGDVEKVFLGGPNLGGDKTIIAGTMLSNSRMLVAQGETTLSIVDLTASLEAQEWRLTSFEVAGAKAMTTLTTIPGADNLVLVRDGERMMIINLDTKAVQGSVLDLSGRTVIVQSLDDVPHFLSLDRESEAAVPLQVHYVSAGVLTTKSLQVRSTAIARSRLAADHAKLTLVFYAETNSFDADYYAGVEVLRYRLSDGLLLDKSEVVVGRKFVLLDNFMVLKSPSILGLTERRTYGKEPEVLQITKYNLPFLQKSYRENK